MNSCPHSPIPENSIEKCDPSSFIVPHAANLSILNLVFFFYVLFRAHNLTTEALAMK